MNDNKVRELGHLEHYACEWSEAVGMSLSVEDIDKSKAVSDADESFVGLGKFQSAMDERLWEASLDEYEVTGDVEYDGHHVLITFTVRDLVDFGIVGSQILHGNFTNIPVGAIVTTVNSGAVDVSYYDTGAELDKAWEECLAESNNYAQEEDGFLGHERGVWSVGINGVHFENYDDRREAAFMLYLECHRSGFFPNCWEVSDHGNETLLFDTTEKVRDMLVEYVEFRNEQDDE